MPKAMLLIKCQSHLDRKVWAVCFLQFLSVPFFFSFLTLPLWMQTRGPAYTKSEVTNGASHQAQDSRSQNSLSGIKSSPTHILKPPRQARLDCTERPQFTLLFLVAMIYLLKQCSHSIRQPGTQPPYFELKLVCTVELRGEKQAILKSRGLDSNSRNSTC